MPPLDGASPGVCGVQNGNRRKQRDLGIDDDRSAGEDDDPDE
jgi:hypothetical protein